MVVRLSGQLYGSVLVQIMLQHFASVPFSGFAYLLMEAKEMPFQVTILISDSLHILLRITFLKLAGTLGLSVYSYMVSKYNNG